MLRLDSVRRAAGYCDGLSRRSFLRVGSLGFAGVALPQLLAARAQASGSTSYVQDRSVVLLFLSGGPSQIEFFDPKCDAPVEFRSITGEVQTAIPGVTFGGTFPRLATMTDDIAVVRSFGSKNTGHTYEKVASGDNSLQATMSAIYGRIAGTTAASGLPSNILVKPEAVRGELELDRNFETEALSSLTQGGSLGDTFAAFDPSGGGPMRESMELRLPTSRLGNRQELLRDLDRLRFEVDESGALETVDAYRRQAFEIITDGIGKAFDLSLEDPQTLAKYDTTGIFRASELQQFFDMRRATNLLGHQMLLARRLCEAGCGFVTVSDCGWDMHANENSPKNMAGMWPMGQQVDHAVAAFIEDVRERGLSDRILLIVTGEMGRTPRINDGGGRDHYGELTPLLLAGGGLNMGGIIGSSDSTASLPVGEAYDPRHLFGTVMHSLFDVTQMRLDQSVPRDILRTIEDAPRIEPLFG